MPPMKYTDIAIIGGGLAGATAAAILGRAGVAAIMVDPHPSYPPDFRIEKLGGDGQIERLRKLRESRDNRRVRASLHALRDAAAANDVNMMPYILDCVRAYATLGEICDELRGVYGVYEEPAF